MFRKIFRIFFPVKPYGVRFNDELLEYEVYNTSTFQVETTYVSKRMASNYADMLNAFDRHNITTPDELYDRAEDREVGIYDQDETL